MSQEYVPTYCQVAIRSQGKRFAYKKFCIKICLAGGRSFSKEGCVQVKDSRLVFQNKKSREAFWSCFENQTTKEAVELRKWFYHSIGEVRAMITTPSVGNYLEWGQQQRDLPNELEDQPISQETWKKFDRLLEELGEEAA